MIVGIDEVGRGAWAGPLVVGAVVLGDSQINDLTDSKKLTAKQRRELASVVRSNAKAIGLGWVSSETIDKIGLGEALKMAARLAVKEIDVPYNQIIVDGTVKLIDASNVSTIKKADLLVPSVSAASIVAKVARDYYMSEIVHKQYPEYGFNAHVGYGTVKHLEALQEHGATDMHRLSFAPVKKALGAEISEVKTNKIAKTSGRQAEDIASEFLKQNGYKIISQNWRTKLCEIDIVAKKADATYLIEVKYRKTGKHGDGLAYITPKKLEQMQFASRVWQHWQNDQGSIRLVVIAMSGKPPKVDELIEI